ncbi:MAG: arginine--tRNA ligase [Clostridia bacterium]|nr:arginine--tRNA ligase [Lachnospiraceae bacterium]NCC00966.1 arginine--tRNA ligase [Clostridia bacterium]
MRNLIIELLSAQIENMDAEEIGSLLEIPPKSDMGDFAFPCFKLAKVFRKAPPMIAAELKEKMGCPEFLDKVECLGGYLNFFVDKSIFAKQIVDNYLNANNYGSSTVGEGKTICIDYSSPNVAKNFHVGHLRTTIIGNSLNKIYTKLGYHVERINHLGDWGTQFGKLIVAYKRWGSKEAVEKDGIEELMRIYVKFHDEAENDESLNDEARAWFTKMEHGDEEALSIWKWFREISLNEFMRIYKLLGIEFDSFAGESFYNDKMEPVIEELKQKGLIKVSDGAQIVELEEYNMPPCLITKKDGSSLYATRDIAAAMYRKKTYDFEKCIYVTGLEQKLHFAQWFKVIELMGYDWSKNLVHVPYGLVSLKGGKLSSRKGNVIFAEDILKEAIQKTRTVIEEKNPDIPNKEEVAKQVGIGAILFNDLYNQRIKDVIFDWEKLLNFDGETGPYVQYTYARAASVIRKIGQVPNIYDYSVLSDDVSMALLKEIARYPQVIVDAAEKMEPFMISRYAVALAQAFNRFYHECQINVENDNVKYTRANAVIMTKAVLKDALGLLGIEAPEQM